MLAATLMAHTAVPASRRERERVATGVLREVADALGNTLAVARGSYVDPRVVDAWSRGDTITSIVADLPPSPDRWSLAERRAVEQAVLDLVATQS